MKITETSGAFSCAAIFRDEPTANPSYPSTDGKKCIYNTAGQVSTCSAHHNLIQRFCPCNGHTASYSLTTRSLTTQVLGQSTDPNLILYYSFSPNTISDGIISNMGAAQYSSISGALQNGAYVVNNQLVLSGGQSQQYMKTVTPFGTTSVGLTIACWFRSANNGQWARVFDFGNGKESDNILVSTTGSSAGITFQVYQGKYSTEYTLPGFYNDNIWRHVGWVLTLEISGYSTWTIYINGMAVQQLQSMRYPNAISRSNNYLGKSNWDGDPYFSGAISDFRLYNRVLSATEFAVLYAGTPTALPTAQPTFLPTTSPTGIPSPIPTAQPTSPPTMSPTAIPSPIPTAQPTSPPTMSPTATPSSIPTAPPTFSTSTAPTSAPTIIPYTALFVSKYLSFSGSNYYGYSSLAKALNSTFSVSAWIATNSRPASIVSLGRSSAAASSGGEFVLEINKDGDLNFWDYSPSTGPGFSILGGDVTNNQGSRVHVAVTRNGFECSLYINGQPVGQSISHASVVYKNAFLVFGVDYRNKSNYFKGTMDHIAIYSQSLSESEIDSLYNAEVGPPTPMPASPISGGSGGGSPNGCEKNCTIGVSIGGSVVFVGILACVLYFCYKHNYPAPSHGSPSPVSPVEEGVPPTETPPGTTLPPVSALAFAYALLEWLSYSFQHFWRQLFNTFSTTVDEPESSEHVIIHQYLCPITHEIMTDPVNTEAGQTYERAAIESWFQENHSTDPMTGEVISRTLIPNIALRQLIEIYNLERNL